MELHQPSFRIERLNAGEWRAIETGLNRHDAIDAGFRASRETDAPLRFVCEQTGYTTPIAPPKRTR